MQCQLEWMECIKIKKIKELNNDQGIFIVPWLFLNKSDIVLEKIKNYDIIKK